MKVLSRCDDCNCGYAIPYIYRCDKEYGVKHTTCDDDCNPMEIRYVPRWHKTIDVYRCSECGTLNTRRNY